MPVGAPDVPQMKSLAKSMLQTLSLTVCPPSNISLLSPCAGFGGTVDKRVAALDERVAARRIARLPGTPTIVAHRHNR